MNRTALLLLSLGFLCTTVNHLFGKEAEKFISIENAIGKNSLKVQLQSLGGHWDECIEIEITNLLSDSIFVLIEAGRILESEDPKEQDIVIVKERRLAIGPLGKFITRLRGFCGQSHNSSPRKGSKFYIGKMGNKALIAVARFIDRGKFPSQAIQNAIWVMTNNNPISSIHDEDPELVRPLVNLVGELKGIKIPWYTMTFEQDTAMLFSGRPEMLSAQISYRISSNARVDMNLRTEDGKIIRRFMTSQLHNPDKYTYDLKLNVNGWRPGNYYFHLYADGNLKIKKVFELN